jgi:hypothetical protein
MLIAFFDFLTSGSAFDTFKAFADVVNWKD